MPKTERLNFRLAIEDGSLFREAAAVAGETVSEFMMESGRERAQRLLADRRHFVLDDEQWREFTRALDRSPKADPRLAKLFTRARP
jgi:uncharacterized protein (DUF1778 family)